MSVLTEIGVCLVGFSLFLYCIIYTLIGRHLVRKIYTKKLVRFYGRDWDHLMNFKEDMVHGWVGIVTIIFAGIGFVLSVLGLGMK